MFTLALSLASLAASPDLRLLVYTAGTLNTFTTDHVIVASDLKSHVQSLDDRCLFTVSFSANRLQINPDGSREKAGFVGRPKPLVQAQFQLYLANNFYADDRFLISLHPQSPCLMSGLAQVEIIAPQGQLTRWVPVQITRGPDGPILRAHLKLRLSDLELSTFSNLSYSVRVDNTVDLSLTLPFSFSSAGASPLAAQSLQSTE